MVILLDPRTPHQPEKLQKLSKNEYVFTPSIFWVNEKIEIVCALNSIECSRFTGVCSESGAAGMRRAPNRTTWPANFPPNLESVSIARRPQESSRPVKKTAQCALGADFTTASALMRNQPEDPQAPGRREAKHGEKQESGYVIRSRALAPALEHSDQSNRKQQNRSTRQQLD